MVLVSISDRQQSVGQAASRWSDPDDETDPTAVDDTRPGSGDGHDASVRNRQRITHCDRTGHTGRSLNQCCDCLTDRNTGFPANGDRGREQFQPESGRDINADLSGDVRSDADSSFPNRNPASADSNATTANCDEGAANTSTATDRDPAAAAHGHPAAPNHSGRHDRWRQYTIGRF